MPCTRGDGKKERSVKRLFWAETEPRPITNRTSTTLAQRTLISDELFEIQNRDTLSVSFRQMMTRPTTVEREYGAVSR
jgi:hypothetical protein